MSWCQVLSQAYLVPSNSSWIRRSDMPSAVPRSKRNNALQ